MTGGGTGKSSRAKPRVARRLARRSGLTGLRSAQVRDVGETDPSLDQLVGTLQQGRWDRQPERLRGLEIDHQLELRRLLDREVRRVRSLQDPVHVLGDAAERAVLAGPTGT
jgi:hypothetical protein